MATATEKKPLTMKEAAKKLLEDEGGPLKSDTITQRALDGKLIKVKGETPKATMAAQLSVDVKKADSEFVKTKPGTYGLKGRDRKGQAAKD
jgi:hypothetical protein